MKKYDMNKLSSISMMVLGIGLLVIGLKVDNIFARFSLLFTSIVINIMAVVRSFREKKGR